MLLRDALLGFGALALLVGCGSSGSGKRFVSASPSLVQVDEPPGENCKFGGVALLKGFDTNDDGELHGDEVESTQYICNGADAVEASLVGTTVLQPGDANCPNGGIRLVSGVDGDGDGTLASDEVERTQYVCNGGEAAAELIATTALEAGDENCPAGGIALERGVDEDGSGALEGNEVEETSYLCNGVVDGAVVCTFPAAWNAEASTCERSNDWSGEDLSSASLASEYLAGVDFSGANLSNADLSFAELRGADLSGADLSDADLSHASAKGTDFSDSVLDGANLSGVDLSEAILAGAAGQRLVECPESLPSGWLCIDLEASGKTLLSPDADLSGMDLSGADLSGVDLGGVQVTELQACPAILPDNWVCLELPQTGLTLVGPGADLSGLDLSGADFSSVTRLSGVDFSSSNLTDAVFGDDTDLSNANFSNTTLTGATFGDNLAANGAVFDGADLTGASFGANADFQQADLSNANLSDAAFAAGADFTGAQFDDTNLHSATLDGAVLDTINLATSTLTGVRATNLQECPDTLPDGWDCVMDTLVGPTADVSGVNFSGEDLSGVDLGGANLTNTVLRGADLEGANLAAAVMAGVRAYDLQACPDALPTGWQCVQDTLVGPGANLSNLDLSGYDLSGVDLTDANLSDADLSDADLTGATVTGADFSGVTWNNTTCPNGSNSDDNGGTCL